MPYLTWGQQPYGIAGQVKAARKKTTGGGGGGPGLSTVTNPFAGLAGAIGPMLTPAQQYAQARKLVGASIAPELAAYNKQAAVESQQLLDQSRRAQEYAKALGLITAPSADRIRDAYMSAAEFEKGLGTGLTGDVATGWQAATDRANQVAQQMTGGMGGPVGQYDPAAARSVAQLTGVAMPAATLAEQGLNQMAMADFARRANVAQVGDIAQQYLSKRGELLSTQDAERAKLLAQKPALVMQEANTLATQRQNQLTQLMNVRKAAADWVNTQQANLIKQQSADAYNQYLTGKTTLSGEELAWKKRYDQQRIANERTRNQISNYNATLRAAGLTGLIPGAKGEPATVAGGWYQNPLTGKVEKQPSGTYIGKDGLPHRVATPTTPKGEKQPSFNDIQTLRTNMLEGVQNRLHPGSLIKSMRTVWPRKRITEYLMNQFGDDFIAIYPNQRTQVKKMVDSVADSIIAQYPKGK